MLTSIWPKTNKNRLHIVDIGTRMRKNSERWNTNTLMHIARHSQKWQRQPNWLGWTENIRMKRSVPDWLSFESEIYKPVHNFLCRNFVFAYAVVHFLHRKYNCSEFFFYWVKSLNENLSLNLAFVWILCEIIQKWTDGSVSIT